VTRGFCYFVFLETTAAGRGVAKVGDTDSLFPPDQSEDYWLYCCREKLIAILGRRGIHFQKCLRVQWIKGVVF